MSAASAVDPQLERDLQRVEAALAAMGAGLAEVDRARLETWSLEVEVLAERLRPGGIEVGIVGLVNAGKSTLLNALLGRVLSPISALPATGVFVRLDARLKSARVIFLEEVRRRPRRISPEEIARYATHEGNPDNRRRVERVEIPLEDSLLGPAVGLTDTPGHRDFLQREPERLQRYLDERLDVCLLVGSAATLWSAANFDLLARALRRCPKVFLVANLDVRARSIDPAGASAAARDDAALLERLDERLMALPRAAGALSDGTLEIHPLALEALFEEGGGGAEQAALERLMEALRGCLRDPSFEQRRAGTLSLAAGDLAGAILLWCRLERPSLEERLRAEERSVQLERERREHAVRMAERASAECRRRAQELEERWRAQTARHFDGEILPALLVRVRSWRSRREPARHLLDACCARLEAGEAAVRAEIDSGVQRALDFLSALEVGTAAPVEDLKIPAAGPWAEVLEIEELIGQPRAAGRLWIGIPIGILCGLLALWVASTVLEGFFEARLLRQTVALLGGLLAAVLAGWFGGRLGGALLWERLLRSGISPLIKRLLVPRVEAFRYEGLRAQWLVRAEAGAAELRERLAGAFAPRPAPDPAEIDQNELELLRDQLGQVLELERCAAALEGDATSGRRGGDRHAE